MNSDYSYSDSKGIRHHSQSAADLANQQYLKEEREARDNIKKLLKAMSDADARRQKEEREAREKVLKEEREAREKVVKEEKEAREKAVKEEKEAREKVLKAARAQEVAAQAQAAAAQAARRERDYQEKHAQFLKDVSLLERESNDGKLDYLTKRSLQDCGPSTLAGVCQSPFRLRLINMLNERIHGIQEVQRVTQAVSEKSQLQERKRAELSLMREDFEKLKELQAIESELTILRKQQSDILKKFRDEFAAESDFRHIAANLVSRMIRECIEQFQENLPAKCKVDLDLVSGKWFETSHQTLLDELEKRAKDIVQRAAPNEDGRFSPQYRM